MNSDKIKEAANRLWDASQSGDACAPVRELIDAQDVGSAYEVQWLNTQRRLDEGEKIIGSKIGLTSFAVQKQLGVDQPDYGILFDSMQIDHELDHSALMQPKAEAEIAFVLGKDLSVDPSEDELVDAIDHACAAIEIVGSRVKDWNIRIADTIADNASASHFVLGCRKVDLSEIDVVHCKMRMSKNGEEVSSGTGEACMGSPLTAALWLAKTMGAKGMPLKKGEIILSGALGPMAEFEKGDNFVAEIEGLGSVEFKSV